MEMFSLNCFRGKNKKAVSLLLSVVLAVMVFFPYLPPLQLKAAENDGLVTLTTAHGDFGGDHKLYCIDKGGLAIWGIADDGDQYQRHSVSNMRIPLSEKEQEYVFWGILTLQASLGMEKAATAIMNINNNASAQGKVSINTFVTEEDLKALIYRSDVRAKYPWLETVAANTEEYLKMAGLIGSGNGTTQSGKKIPEVIANCTTETTAYQINRSDFTIHFDESGADADFIATVPIFFWNDTVQNYVPDSVNGWTYTKTATSITFHHANPKPAKLRIRFAVEGTDYSTVSGGYASERDLFEKCLQIWECVKCSGTHVGGTPATSPTEIHQRMVWLETDAPKTEFYAALGGNPVLGSEGAELAFNVFRHAEDFVSTYNVQMYKYDHETGEPLEGARFVLYERFDDQGEIDREKDGPVHIYEGGEPYASYHTDDPVLWEGFRQIGTLVTGEDGRAAQTVTHGYHYDKTFCDGHPAPVFTAVPEPEEDEETGETLNTEAIEAAKAVNRANAQKWLDTVADCEEKAGDDFEGVHFHWLMEEVNQEEIESAAESGGEEGTTPDGGATEEPDADTAYEESGCYQDMLDTYKKFISLKYSYALTEFQARGGYIRHDLHSADLPVEIITTDASENGANASFAGEYSVREKLEAEAARYSLILPAGKDKEEQEEMAKEKKSADEKKERPILFQKLKEISQAVCTFFFPEEEELQEIEEEEIEEKETEEGETEEEGAEAEETEQSDEEIEESQEKPGHSGVEEQPENPGEVSEENEDKNDSSEVPSEPGERGESGSHDAGTSSGKKQLPLQTGKRMEQKKKRARGCGQSGEAREAGKYRLLGTYR